MSDSLKINIESKIREKCPALRLGYLQMKVSVNPSSERLLQTINQTANKLASRYELERISRHPIIWQSREGYKALGKKPGRYRPSAEALLRRVVSGKGLYRINNVVDITNYISIRSGFSIGGYDLDQIIGTPSLSIGQENEPYEAIARGQLNVGRLAVLRDDISAFGSPTSDSVRTSIRSQTQTFLMVFYDFGSDPSIEEWLAEAGLTLKEHAEAKDLQIGLL